MDTNKPKMPIGRIRNNSLQVGICNECGSSLRRKKFWYLWGLVACINNECKNSNK